MSWVNLNSTDPENWNRGTWVDVVLLLKTEMFILVQVVVVNWVDIHQAQISGLI